MSSQERLRKRSEGRATSPGNQAYPKRDLEQTQLLLIGATQVLELILSEVALKVGGRDKMGQ